MSVLSIILFCIILSILFGKWILLLILTPVLRYHFLHEREKAVSLHEKDNEILTQSLVKDSISDNEHDYKPDLKNNKNIRHIIYKYLSGFERYMIIQTGLIPSHRIRNLIYKQIFLIRMTSSSIIYYGAEIRGSYNLILDKGAIIGDHAVLDARRGYIKIGQNVQLGSFVKLWTGSHDLNDPYFRSMPGKRGPIEIENHVWIGPNATILHSVKIGEGAVVAAGAVVTKDVEPFSIIGGVPAKKIGTRSNNLKYEIGKTYIPFY